jgi:CBS domain-containing protein
MADEKLRDVMTQNPCTIPKSAMLADAARAMRDKNIGGVVVTDDDGKLCGFVTDRDIVVRAVAQGQDPTKTTLESVCSKQIQSLSPNDSVDEAIKLMASKAVRRVPIIENGKAIGIVSVGDLAMARDKRSALGGISAAPPNQ